MASYRDLAILVEKTGGADERLAFGLLVNRVLSVARDRGIDPEERR